MCTTTVLRGGFSTKNPSSDFFWKLAFRLSTEVIFPILDLKVVPTNVEKVKVLMGFNRLNEVI